MSVDWLYFRWWTDADGRVWIWHDCAGVERIEPLETSTWREAGGSVAPSVDCRACGKHAVLMASDRCKPPKEWTDPVRARSQTEGA